MAGNCPYMKHISAALCRWAWVCHIIQNATGLANYNSRLPLQHGRAWQSVCHDLSCPAVSRIKDCRTMPSFWSSRVLISCRAHGPPSRISSSCKMCLTGRHLMPQAFRWQGLVCLIHAYFQTGAGIGAASLVCRPACRPQPHTHTHSHTHTHHFGLPVTCWGGGPQMHPPTGKPHLAGPTACSLHVVSHQVLWDEGNQHAS